MAPYLSPVLGTLPTALILGGPKQSKFCSTGPKNYLKAIEVCEEGTLAINVRVDAQGQLFVHIVPDVYQDCHVQRQSLHSWTQEQPEMR